jgi:hypothetical protein
MDIVSKGEKVMEQKQDAYSRRMGHIKRWNKKTYRERCIRLHRGSELDNCLSAFCESGGSVNFLIAELLAAHFKCPLPYKEKHTRKRVQIFP